MPNFKLFLFLTSAPGGFPQSLRATGIQAFSLTVAWDQVTCGERRSAIASYTVVYGRADQFGSGGQLGNISGITDFSVTIVGLMPETRYTFRVGAVNTERIPGPLSPPVTIATMSERESDFVMVY